MSPLSPTSRDWLSPDKSPCGCTVREQASSLNRSPLPCKDSVSSSPPQPHHFPTVNSTAESLGATASPHLSFSSLLLFFFKIMFLNTIPSNLVASNAGHLILTITMFLSPTKIPRKWVLIKKFVSSSYFLLYINTYWVPNMSQALPHMPSAWILTSPAEKEEEKGPQLWESPSWQSQDPRTVLLPPISEFCHFRAKLHHWPQHSPLDNGCGTLCPAPIRMVMRSSGGSDPKSLTRLPVASS